MEEGKGGEGKVGVERVGSKVERDCAVPKVPLKALALAPR